MAVDEEGKNKTFGGIMSTIQNDGGKYAGKIGLTAENMQDVLDNILERSAASSLKSINAGGFFNPMIAKKPIIERCTQTKSREEFIWWIMHSSLLKCWDDETEEWLDYKIINALNEDELWIHANTPSGTSRYRDDDIIGR